MFVFQREYNAVLFFRFNTIHEAQLFIQWIQKKTGSFSEIVSETSRYAKLKAVRHSLEGNSVIVTFEYTTGDAAGQNMVTIYTDQLCQFIIANTTIQPERWYIESNYTESNL